jgi:hypothetical protein
MTPGTSAATVTGCRHPSVSRVFVVTDSKARPVEGYSQCGSCGRNLASISTEGTPEEHARARKIAREYHALHVCRCCPGTPYVGHGDTDTTTGKPPR